MGEVVPQGVVAACLCLWHITELYQVQ